MQNMLKAHMLIDAYNEFLGDNQIGIELDGEWEPSEEWAQVHANLMRLEYAQKFYLDLGDEYSFEKRCGISIEEYKELASTVELPYGRTYMELKIGKDRIQILMWQYADPEIAFGFSFFIYDSKEKVMRSPGELYQYYKLLKSGDLIIPDESDKQVKGEIAYLIGIVIRQLEILNCSNVEYVDNEIPEKLNKKRAKKKKTPFFSYKTLQIKNSHRQNKNYDESDRQSPKQHLRRGHVRRLPTKKVWVSSCIVGDSLNGSIVKSYTIAR